MEHSQPSLKKQPEAIGILRVSSTKQGIQGDSPDDQKKTISPRAAQNTHKISKWFRFFESASVNAKRQPVLDIIEFCKANPQIKVCYVKSIDRFTRGGARIYSQLSDALDELGVQLIDVYGIRSSQKTNTLSHLGKKYPWSEFRASEKAEMLEAERAKDEVREILTRMVSGSIQKVRDGYAIGEAPYGYSSQRVETSSGKRAYILVPHPEESRFILKMFELAAQGKTLKEIVDTVNILGFKTRTRYKRKKTETGIIKAGKIGGVSLSEKQLGRYLQNPIYCGVSIHSHLSFINDTEGVEHFEPKFIRSKGLVSVELWNGANHGKKTILVGQDGSPRILEGQKLERFVKKSKSNPAYPYKGYLQCHLCHHPLKASAPRSKSGIHVVTYHCSYGHDYWGINGKKLHTLIKSFIENLGFSDEFRSQFRAVMLEEWEKRRDQANELSIEYEKEVLRIKQEQRLILDTIKGVKLEAMKNELENEFSQLEKNKVEAVAKRDTKEHEEINIQTVIAYCNYWMEHLKELLLDSDKPLESARLFSLCFDEPPTVLELENGTPKLSPLFRLNEEYSVSEKTHGEPAGTRTQDTLLKRQML